MKNLLIIMIGIHVLLSCSKSDEESDIQKNTHRIKQIFANYSEDFNHGKLIYSYVKDKLTEMTGYERENGYADWKETSKASVKYKDKTATIIRKEKKADEWVFDVRVEFKIENDLIMEEIFYYYEEEKWESGLKWTYQYAGNKIISWMNYKDKNEDETFDEYEKGQYMYQDGKLIKQIKYKLDTNGEWYQNGTEVFSYEGDKLVNIIIYLLTDSGGLRKNNKYEYFYDDGKVSSISYFIMDNKGDWIMLNSESYKYDDLGYLIEEVENDENVITYEYEQGHGNVQLFWFFIENLVYNVPTLKSSNPENRYIPYYKILKKSK